MTTGARIALVVLYVEAIANIAAALVFMAAPALFADAFLRPVLTPSAVELGRWYGVTLFTMSAMQLAVLQARDPLTMRWVLLAMLSGDALQIVASAHVLRLAPATMYIATPAIVLSVVYAGARIVWIRSVGRVSSDTGLLRPQAHVGSAS